MKKFALFIPFILILLLILIFGGKYMDIDLKQKFVEFNSANIDGNIEYYNIQSHRLAFKLVNNNSLYLFNPYPIGEEQSFEDIVKAGDKLLKRSFSDTIYIYKNGKCYKYTFEKF